MQEEKGSREIDGIEQRILAAAKEYHAQTGNADHIPVTVIEKGLGWDVKSLQLKLGELVTSKKIEVVEKADEGEITVIKLTHWTIRNDLP